MDMELIVKVCEVTKQTYNFNEYLYRLIACKTEMDSAFDMLIPIESEVNEGDILKVSKCKIVRIDYDLDYTRIAVRIDQFEICEEGTELSKYFNVPFIGMIKKMAKTKVTKYGPDKIRFIRVLLQMRDADKKAFVIPMLGFNNKATLLDSLDNETIITGIATIKHKNGSERYELALYSAEKYTK